MTLIWVISKNSSAQHFVIENYVRAPSVEVLAHDSHSKKPESLESSLFRSSGESERTVHAGFNSELRMFSRGLNKIQIHLTRRVDSEVPYEVN